MRTFAIVVCLSLLAAPAAADFTLEITEALNLQSNDGFVIQSREPGFPTEEFFVFEEDGKVRFYAVREVGLAWDVLPAGVYLVPTTTITQGMTWPFLDEGENARQAEAIGLEAVSNNAGSFTAWRVDITETGNPDSVQAMYWVDGVGLVREADFLAGNLDGESNLESYSVTGAGYFPLVVGNIWNFSSSSVSTRATSIGSLKSEFGN